MILNPTIVTESLRLNKNKLRRPHITISFFTLISSVIVNQHTTPEPAALGGSLRPPNPWHAPCLTTQQPDKKSKFEKLKFSTPFSHVCGRWSAQPAWDPSPWIPTALSSGSLPAEGKTPVKSLSPNLAHGRARRVQLRDEATRALKSSRVGHIAAEFERLANVLLGRGCGNPALITYARHGNASSPVPGRVGHRQVREHRIFPGGSERPSGTRHHRIEPVQN